MVHCEIGCHYVVNHFVDGDHWRLKQLVLGIASAESEQLGLCGFVTVVLHVSKGLAVPGIPRELIRPVYNPPMNITYSSFRNQ